MMSLYEDLGVPKNADRATIKKAYRRKAQKLHPDREGGDAEKFHAVQLAYDVLYDDARRAHYDQHGTDGHQDPRGALLQRLAALFIQLIETQDVDHTDIVAAMRNALVQGKSNTQQQIRAQEQKIERYERAKKRVKKKSDGDNMLLQLLDGQISLMRRGLELGKLELSNVDEMLKMLADYQYTVETGQRGGQFAFAPPGAFNVFGSFGSQP